MILVDTMKVSHPRDVIPDNHMLSKDFARNLPCVSVLAAGCHHIKSDYPAFLAKHGAYSDLPQTNVRARYAIDSRTSLHYYEVRSFAAGYGNRWIVEFGQMLDQTLQSDYVQGAFHQLLAARRGKMKPVLSSCSTL